MAPHSRKVKKSKCVKASQKDLALCFSEGMQVGDVMGIVNKDLVGSVRGRSYSTTRPHLWFTYICKNILRELPSVTTLACGWFALRFQREYYISWVPSWYWNIKLASVLLKRWSLLFDPQWEQLGTGPLWVHFPGFPLHFWFEDIFTCIGNALGTFVYYYKPYISSRNKSMACILVHLDTTEGIEV